MGDTCPRRHRIEVPRASLPAGDGLVVVDKPSGVSSHGVVNALRSLAGTRKVGHAGTLDPMATGVLLVGVGKGTKLLHYLTGCDKTYEATIRFGVSTTTEDADGDAVATPGCSQKISPDILREASEKLTGTFEQRPSSVSALKMGGKRAYQLVRSGEEVILPTRKVTVSWDSSWEGLPETYREKVPVWDVKVSVQVSSGTYVRAIARDIGEIIGVPAHLVALRRTSVGNFTIEDAKTIDSLSQKVADGISVIDFDLTQTCVSMFPTISLEYSQAKALTYGQALRKELNDVTGKPLRDGSKKDRSENIWAALYCDKVVALLKDSEDFLKPVVVFNTTV